MFDWLRNRRRKRLLAAVTTSDWIETLQNRLWQYRHLSSPQRQKLHGWIRIFIHERHWEGCDGLKLTEQVKLLVAAQAGLLVLGHDNWYFDRTPSILIYPEEYTVRDVPRSTGGGFTIVGDEDRSGEAWYRGPIVLSLPGILSGAGSPNHGHNLVIHEFAHHLDMIDDPFADGKPPIADPQLSELWDRVVSREFQRLRRQCNAGLRPLLNCYGASSEAEFFCVASETFFQLPLQMAEYLPDLYDVFSKFYRLDPQDWVVARSVNSN